MMNMTGGIRSRIGTQAMEKFEEELTVPTGGTATTSDGAVTVGCETAYPHEAQIGFSLASGETFNPEELKPSQSHELNSNEHSYRVVLLSTNYNTVRVRVIHFPRESLKPKRVEPSGVRILETRISRMAELKRLVQAELPETGFNVDSKYDGTLLTVSAVTRKLGFFRSGETRTVLEIFHPAGQGLFKDGQLDDLHANVYDGSFLTIANKVAESYASKTRRSVTILKRF
jgi:hypothetical protein